MFDARKLNDDELEQIISGFQVFGLDCATFVVEPKCDMSKNIDKYMNAYQYENISIDKNIKCLKQQQKVYIHFNKL